MLPENVVNSLNAREFVRENDAEVISTLRLFPQPATDDFREFFRRYRGPVGSDHVGYQLLDLVEGEPNIRSATFQVRDAFGLPERFIVISDLLAGAVLIYDTDSDGVYDVDFEGGLDLMLENRLVPRWGQFHSFLEDFFG